MRALGQRLRGLERVVAARVATDGPAVLVVFPDDSPLADRDAFDAAARRADLVTRWELVERFEGQRPKPGTALIEFRLREDGPA